MSSLTWMLGSELWAPDRAVFLTTKLEYIELAPKLECIES